MAWEWVAPVSTAVVAVVLGVAGIRHTYKSAALQVEGNLKLAREEREQRRLERAYDGILAKLTRTGIWANSLHGDSVSTRPWDPDKLAQDEAHLAYISDEVATLLIPWELAADRINQAVLRIIHGSARRREEAQLDVLRLRIDLGSTELAVRTRIREELRAANVAPPSAPSGTTWSKVSGAFRKQP